MGASAAALRSRETYEGGGMPSERSEFYSPASATESNPSAGEVYEGCWTPSERSEFYSAASSIGSNPSARDSSFRSDGSCDLLDDEFSHISSRATTFAEVFGLPLTSSETDSFSDNTGEGTIQLVGVYEQNNIALESLRFPYAEIVRITDGFERVFGRGNYGIVYPGQMNDGTPVAVKMFSEKLWHVNVFSDQFEEQVHLAVRAQHKNLLRILGHCHESKKMALILEYMPQGNLGSFLEAINGNPLTWQQRIHVALDVAQGLEYLHVGCRPPVVHGNIKLTNILLNERLEAKIADFWFSKIFLKETFSHWDPEEHFVWTNGYAAPEYILFGNLSILSDVYSFGVVLLKLISGKLKSTDRNLFKLSHSAISERTEVSLIDPKLQDNYNRKSVSKAIGIAIACTSYQPQKRPTMSNVVTELRACLELDSLQQLE